MQLAMIGLGRMGGNMTERLMRDGHQVVVFDRSAEVVEKYATLGAIGAGSPAEVARKLTVSACCLDHGAGRQAGRRHDCGTAARTVEGRRHHRRWKLELPRHDAARSRARAEGNQFRRFRDQRRNMGPGEWLLSNDWRIGGSVRSMRAHFQIARTGRGIRPHGSTRFRPLREDDSQRNRVRKPAGVRRGL